MKKKKRNMSAVWVTIRCHGLAWAERQAKTCIKVWFCCLKRSAAFALRVEILAIFVFARDICLHNPASIKERFIVCTVKPNSAHENPGTTLHQRLGQSRFKKIYISTTCVILLTFYTTIRFSSWFHNCARPVFSVLFHPPPSQSLKWCWNGDSIAKSLRKCWFVNVFCAEKCSIWKAIC